MRVMMAGDWHGDARHAEYCFLQAKENNVDVILQLGDFGYWEHTDDGITFLDALSIAAQMFKIPVYWIDGNHENHVLLRDKYTDLTADGFAEIRPDVYYIPRGTVWTWDGVRFLGLGGAFSIDRNFRRVGTSFWFEETITNEEVALASKNGQPSVDVMVAHDVPTGVDINMHFMIQQNRRLKPSTESDINRDAVRAVALEVKPKLLFHGHYHLRYKEVIVMPYGELEVHGLGCEWMYQDSWTILDTVSFT